ncbi:MAG TPA: c-type cytochrome biogenesis protein CcmI [Caulobacteraceae bacterium]|nr:c-type cytochrome biogenesis protein CcmI [Caulobacteraceae bacterium]
MIAFWVAAALLSAAVAVLIVLRAARAAASKSAEDPALNVYRRQLGELDELASRGLLPPREQRSARTEAARRLLAAAQARPPAADGEGNRRRLAVTAVAAGTPLVALVAYLVVGSPGTPDQPYAKRLAAWTRDAARGETASQLTAPELAAVLRTVTARRPTDPVALVYLAHADVDSGDPAAAEQDLRRAITLRPQSAALWQLLGETLAMQSGDAPSPQARAAFEHALALDPALISARYALGQLKIAGGDVSGGLADWNTTLAALPANDASRAALAQQIAFVRKTGALQTAEQDAGETDAQVMIRAMVASLAARLKAHPDDPSGWGRLIRSYAVLGDEPARAGAEAAARAEFKDRPAKWTAVEQAEAAPQ